MELKKLRKRIDLLDKKLVDVITERVKVALKISDFKRNKNIHPYSPEREAEVLRRIRRLNPGIIDDEVFEFLFTQIMSITFSLSTPLKIAYLGPKATFTHLAAIKKFGEKVEFIPSSDITSLFSAVENTEVNFGVVPIENSTEGVVTHTLDMFMDSNLHICSEVVLKITHHLLASTPISKVKKIYSHPHVFPQCRKWLARHMASAILIPVETTAKAAEMVKRKKDSACIASEACSRIYNLKILARNIQDSSGNITRFLVIGKYITRPTGHDKTSILFSVKDRVGALHDMLVPFKKNRINLTKIESRPSKKKPWEYYFFVDFQGHHEDKKVKQALRELEKKCHFVNILGSYPKAMW
ncbi:MAG: prephenate dehydratase [Candidatus Omnitrophica bacterium]|nr:prephenate dehydratase [Candidatus Omnitrophota bacterium]